MYATLSYEVSAGSTPTEDVRKQIFKVFEECDTCDFLPGTFICTVKNTQDYQTLATKLRAVGRAVNGQFQYVFTLHNAGGLIRTNATFTKAKADEITGADV
jgi:hypothetical protein